MSLRTLDAQAVQSMLIQAVANVRCTDFASIEQEIVSNGGDLPLDSLEGVAAVAILEGALKRKLPGPEDLEPEQFTSLGALQALVLQKLQETGDVSTAE